MWIQWSIHTMTCNYKSHLKGASEEMGQQNHQPGQSEVKPISSKVPLYLHQPPETRGEWPSGIMDWRQKTQTHSTHGKHFFRFDCTYRGMRYSLEALNTYCCQSDEKVAFPEREKMTRGTDVSLVMSLSIKPADWAQTPLGCTETSGGNRQRGWYSTWSNEKWISLPWYKHRWPERQHVYSDPLWSLPPRISSSSCLLKQRCAQSQRIVRIQIISS